MTDDQVDAQIEKAEDKLLKVISNLVWVMNLNEHNKVAVFSDVLRAQIPASYAANAFNLFSDSVYHMQLVRFCALWDHDLDSDSIPALVDLVNHEPVIERLHSKLEADWQSIKSHRTVTEKSEKGKAELLAWMDDLKLKRAKERADKSAALFRQSIAATLKFQTSSSFVELQNYRTKFIAHSISSLSRKEKKEGKLIDLPRYGAEEKLLTETLEILDGLTVGIANMNYAWSLYKENAAMCAKDLWHKCKFEFSPQD